MTMFNRIVVNVIHMSSPILFISQKMFPEASLPDFLLATRGQRCIYSDCKITLDQSPAGREVGVVRRQLPDTMEMVGQNYHGIHDKGKVFHNLTEREPQPLKIIRQRQDLRAIVSDDREEVAAAVLVCTSIVAHFLPAFVWHGGFASLNPPYHFVSGGIGLTALIHPTELNPPYQNLVNQEL